MEIFAQTPLLDSAYFLPLISRILHIVSAIILVGGIAYLRKVAVAGVATDSDNIAEQLYSGRRKSWAKWVSISTVLLIVTGVYNLILVIKSNPDLPSNYHMLLGIKVLLAMVFFFLVAILAGKTTAADRFRKKAKTWLTLCLVAGLIVVALASTLRSLHQPLPTTVDAPADQQPETE